MGQAEFVSVEHKAGSNGYKEGLQLGHVLHGPDGRGFGGCYFSVSS